MLQRLHLEMRRAIGALIVANGCSTVERRTVLASGLRSSRSRALKDVFVLPSADANIPAIASVTRHRSMAMSAQYAQRGEQTRTSPHRLKDVGWSREKIR